MRRCSHLKREFQDKFPRITLQNVVGYAMIRTYVRVYGQRRLSETGGDAMSSAPEQDLHTEYGTSRQSTAAIPNTPHAEQPTLFTVDTNGKLTPGVALMRELTPDATLTLGRYWFRRFLE